MQLRVFGTVVSEFIDERPQPGRTFGWGPDGTGVLVYSEPESGRLVLLDRAGHKRRLDGVKDTVLPAFSSDGTRIAFLQKVGRKRYVLKTVGLVA